MTDLHPYTCKFSWKRKVPNRRTPWNKGVTVIGVMARDPAHARQVCRDQFPDKDLSSFSIALPQDYPSPNQ